LKSSREIVHEVLEKGISERIPLQVEADDKKYESLLSDVVGFRVRISTWDSFYETGGPFRRRKGERLAEWADRVDPREYPWPDEDIIEDALGVYEERARVYAKGRFLLLKVLGPTETAESFFASPMPGAGQIAHGFSFALLLRIRPAKALDLYDRIASVILKIIKAGCELERVDAVRIADDVASYRGPLYPPMLLDRYLKWHSLFVETAHRKGKWALLHCDGDLRKGDLLGKLADIYDGIHPLDLMPKSTLRDAFEWAKAIAKARQSLIHRRLVFFTGLPVDLIFNNRINARDMVDLVKRLLDEHGPSWLVLATTHSPYPGRGYHEIVAQEKIKAVREYVGSYIPPL